MPRLELLGLPAEHGEIIDKLGRCVPPITSVEALIAHDITDLQRLSGVSDAVLNEFLDAVLNEAAPPQATAAALLQQEAAESQGSFVKFPWTSLSQCFTDGLAGGIIEIYGAAGSGKSKLATATAIATLRRNHNGRCVFVFSCGSDPSWVAPLKEAKVSHRCRLHPSFSVGDITAGRVVLETLIDQKQPPLLIVVDSLPLMFATTLQDGSSNAGKAYVEEFACWLRDMWRRHHIPSIVLNSEHKAFAGRKETGSGSSSRAAWPSDSPPMFRPISFPSLEAAKPAAATKISERKEEGRAAEGSSTDSMPSSWSPLVLATAPSSLRHTIPGLQWLWGFEPRVRIHITELRAGDGSAPSGSSRCREWLAAVAKQGGTAAPPEWQCSPGMGEEWVAEVCRSVATAQGISLPSKLLRLCVVELGGAVATWKCEKVLPAACISLAD